MENLKQWLKLVNLSEITDRKLYLSYSSIGLPTLRQEVYSWGQILNPAFTMFLFEYSLYINWGVAQLSKRQTQHVGFFKIKRRYISNNNAHNRLLCLYVYTVQEGEGGGCWSDCILENKCGTISRRSDPCCTVLMAKYILFVNLFLICCLALMGPLQKQNSWKYNFV